MKFKGRRKRGSLNCVVEQMVPHRRCLFLLLTFLAIASGIYSQIDGTDDRSDAVQIWEVEGVQLKFPKFDSHQFNLTDLERITNNSEKKIGSGAYGNVYLGRLEDGVQVAVKMYNQSSAEAANEFLSEAGSLTRIRHKYFVALIGYCISRSNCMALVYEFVPKGDLYWKLRDRKNPLSWRQRVQIAYESAIGLEYLHKACNPPVIHRDVKTSNILLTASLHAKIADFGISRAFNNIGRTNYNYVPRILGTVGYLDPEYNATGKITLKTDVYSFGVVLLEIITGKGPINVDNGEKDLVQWVRQKLSEGDIESIVHYRMNGKYNINSVRKVMNLASKCTQIKTSERPTMTEIVAELKESLDLEVPVEEMDCKIMKERQLHNGCEPGQHLDFKNVGFWLPLGIGQCCNLYYSKAKI